MLTPLKCERQDAMDQALTQQDVAPLAERERLTKLREAIDPAAQGRYTGPVAGQSSQKPGADGRTPGEEPVERLADPRLVAESPEQIALTTPASAAAFAGGTLSLTTTEDLHAAAGATFAAVTGAHTALFAQAGPVRAIAATGPVAIEAHDGPLELLADRSVTVTATDDTIEILAQDKIVLQAGESAITLEGADITFKCPGSFRVRASQHPFTGPARDAANLPVLPDGNLYSERFKLVEAATGRPAANVSYWITTASGEVIEGVTDENGQTMLVVTPAPEQITLEVEQDGLELKA